MNFVSVRIITTDVNRIANFYESVIGYPLLRYNDDFAELPTLSGTLAIGSIRTLQLFGGAVAEPASNRTAIFEFLVEDVDAEFERLSKILENVLVQAPTTMPWGNRSMMFRDPDGNLVNFFTPVTEEARQKFEKFKS